MELHESLYALGQAQGRELFNDADSFRGALDDWLDEEAATTGDINLLVDAVRLGAFGSMSSMLDSGADSDRAIADAGARLARDRGSADVGGAMWALSVLGFAIGKVSDGQVRTYQAQHASRQVPPPGTAVPPAAGAPTAVKPQVPAGPPPVTQRPGATPPANPVWPSSGGNPTAVPVPPPPAPAAHQSFDPPAGPQQPAYGGGFPPPQGPQPTKTKKSPLLPILAGLVALLVIVAGVIGAIALTGDDDKKDDPSADGSESPDTDEPDMSLEGITERYSALAGAVTSGTKATECVPAESLAGGEEEKIECTVDTGTLVLTTYVGDSEINAARTRAVNLAEGHLTNQVDSGYFSMFDPTDAEDTSRAASLYWDSKAAHQSALLTAGNGADAEALLTAWKATSPTVDEPTRIMSPELQALADQFSIRRCERIPTLYTGELEESQCLRNGKSVWVAAFAEEKDFRDYRALAKQLSKQDKYPVDSYWWDTEDAAQTEQGKIYGYTDDSGNGILYFDDVSCLCYVQAYDNGEGDPVALWNAYFDVE